MLGADDVLAQLQEIVPGRVVQGRPLAVRRVRDGEGVAGLHVLFVGRGANAALARLAEAPALLLVTETEGGLDRGGVINFVRRDGRVRFEVALDNAERRGLRVSSRMLGVAQNVRGRL